MWIAGAFAAVYHLLFLCGVQVIISVVFVMFDQAVTSELLRLEIFTMAG